MKISRREKRVLVGGGLGVLAILAGVYVIEPLVTTQFKIQDELRENRAVLERHELLASEKERYRRKVEALRARYQQAEDLHFKGDKLPVVAAEVQGLLHKLGQDAGITITRENVRPPRKVEMFTEVTVELSVQGELKNIRDFLYKVQTAPKLLTTPRLTIRGMSPRGSTAMVADLQVAGYILGGDEKGSAAPAPSAGAQVRPRPGRG
ncbi:MAG TPA: type II secretion system protein GspM [Candidatus Methylomirabilis sp.]|nr:type II secretion system protein GspM [Candidatus Methylomirabilis sp.]HSC70430.1 type II secretion system protein GspM [Candidatus Methylomirabilis sp.]